MTDNVTLNTGTGGATLATDDISGVQHQRVKIQYGDDGSATDVSDTNPLPIDDAGGSITIDNAALSVVGGGVEATALRVTMANDSTGVVNVSDGGGSITVDGTVTANAGSGPWPVTDNGGSLTVDNSGTFAVQVDGAALTALQLLDDVVSTDGSASPSVGYMICGHDGTNAQRIATDTAGNLQIDVISSLPAGTNAIGKLAANSGVDIGDVDVTSQPARSATTDNIGAALMTNVIHDSTTALTPKFAAISAASSGDNTLVAAVSGKKIRVIQVQVIADSAVSVRFKDGAGGTALTGVMSLAANGGFSAPFTPVGHFETTAATLLNLELSAAVQVSGWLTYVEV